MKLTFLGTGTSVGVPQMRCSCPTCTSSDPRDKRLRASALIEPLEGAPAILIDCGPDFRQQMLRAGCPDLACALLTHTHYDHVGGIDDLRPYAHHCPGAHFPLYCRADVAADLRARVPYCFVEHPYPGVPQFTLHELEPLQPFGLPLGQGFGTVEAVALPVMHGKLPIYGYRIGSFAYITDASEVPPETVAALAGVDTLVLNALRIEEHPSHQNLSHALDVIKLIKPRQAFLTHMSHDIGLHREAELLLPEGVYFAADGLTAVF
ncbi:MAG: MBL fold metallo-hydrolase [Muribaculaceae bacterium]|nr:MBL fold metallo-hydrolase [Muribaculaceae bacterium]